MSDDSNSEEDENESTAEEVSSLELGVDPSVLAGLDFSHVFEELESLQIQEEVLADALQPLQSIPVETLLQQQIGPALKAQRLAAAQPILEAQQEMLTGLQPLMQSHLQDLQMSIAPALAANVVPDLREIRMQTMMPALQALVEMRLPAIQLAAALDEVQMADYAVSEFAAAAATPPAPTSYSTPAEEVSEPVHDASGEDVFPSRETESTVDWTLADSIEVYYSIGAYLLDEAIEGSGVRDLSENQRLGVCLVFAMVMYATTSNYGPVEVATPAAFLYAILKDFSEE